MPIPFRIRCARQGCCSRVRALSVGQPGQLRRVIVAVAGGDSVGQRQCGPPIGIVIAEGNRSAPLHDLRQAIGIVEGIVCNGLSRYRQAGPTASCIPVVVDPYSASGLVGIDGLFGAAQV